jgi:hypothetical protein
MNEKLSIFLFFIFEVLDLYFIFYLKSLQDSWFLNATCILCFILGIIGVVKIIVLLDDIRNN